MKAEELRKLSVEELNEKLNDASEELMRFRFQFTTGELTDHTRIPETRHLIARIRTIIRERELEAIEEGEA